LVGTVQPTPCKAGSFGPQPGLKSEKSCLPCPLGSFCPSGTSEAQLCAKGQYGDQMSQETSQCVGACPAGSFCVAGTQTPVECPLGTYSMSGAGSVEDCLPCGTAAFYCPSPGLEQPISVAVGYMSTSWDGSFGPEHNRTNQTLCGDGYWCSAGKPIACGKGTYADGALRSDRGSCVPCPADATTLTDASTSFSDCVCNEGFYMDSQTCQRCPRPGSNCSGVGATLERLRLEPGYCACAPARERLIHR